MINRKGETVSTTAYLGRLLVKFRMSRQAAAGAVLTQPCKDLPTLPMTKICSANSSQLFLLQMAWSGYLRSVQQARDWGKSWMSGQVAG